MLSCPALSDIREDFLCQLVSAGPALLKYLEVGETLLLAVLDPESPLLPPDLTDSWIDLDQVYSIGRNFCFSMHKKRENLLNEILKKKAVEMNIT